MLAMESERNDHRVPPACPESAAEVRVLQLNANLGAGRLSETAY